MSSRLNISLDDSSSEHLRPVVGERLNKMYKYRVPSLRDWCPEKDARVENRRHQEVHSVIAKIRDFGYNKTAGDDDYVVLDGQRNTTSGKSWSRCFIAAGPREKIFFNTSASDVTAAIVCSGELCPGINTVIRAITQSLVHLYGVKKVLGVR